MLKKKALIVDDFPFDAELTRRVLENCHDSMEVFIVSDGEEALRELERSIPYSVIFLDLKLPKIDGFEVLKSLASKPFLSDIPVVILSSTRDERENADSHDGS